MELSLRWADARSGHSKLHAPAAPLTQTGAATCKGDRSRASRRSAGRSLGWISLTMQSAA
jgi:hypothetical protein